MKLAYVMYICTSYIHSKLGSCPVGGCSTEAGVPYKTAAFECRRRAAFYGILYEVQLRMRSIRCVCLQKGTCMPRQVAGKRMYNISA